MSTLSDRVFGCILAAELAKHFFHAAGTGDDRS